jgi:hypothetical protein
MVGSAGVVVAGRALLDRWSGHDWRDGVHICDLQPLDRLTIHTLNSTYEIVIVTPSTAEVVVRGGTFFPAFARVRLAGASLGGSFLKLHSIHVGFRMELLSESQPIVTSAVQAIAMARPDQVM